MQDLRRRVRTYFPLLVVISNWFDCCRYFGVFLLVVECSNVTLIMLNYVSLNHLMLYVAKLASLASEGVVLGLLRAKCVPILLYATEACSLLSCSKQSLEFTITRIFMKIFQTGSPAIVRECQLNFNFVLIQSQINIHTARFLQKFIVSENSRYSLFTPVTGASFINDCHLHANHLLLQFIDITELCCIVFRFYSHGIQT